MAVSSLSMSRLCLRQGALLAFVWSTATAQFSYSQLGRAGCASQRTAQLGLILNSTRPDAAMAGTAKLDCSQSDCEAQCNELTACTGFTFAQDRIWDPYTFQVVLRNGQCLLHSLEASDYILTACGLPLSKERKCFMKVGEGALESPAQRRRRFYSHFCPEAPSTYQKVSYDRCPHGYAVNFAEEGGTPCQADAPPFNFVKRCELPDCEKRCNDLDWCIGFTVSISVSKFGGYACLFHSTSASDVVSPDYPCGMETSHDCQCWMKPDNSSNATTSGGTSSSTSSSNFSRIISGHTVYLKTLSGAGKHVDVEETRVQARWEERGNWQAFVIENQGGDRVQSGDAVFLKTFYGTFVDVQYEAVRARWNEHGVWQSLIVSRPGGGFIDNGDVICLRAHTGKYIEVSSTILQAIADECSQAFRIEKDDADAFHSGDSVTLKAHTGKYLEVESDTVRARWDQADVWQTFVVENKAGRALYAGDSVFLRAHTGMFMEVEHALAEVRWHDRGEWQRFTIEKKDGPGALYPGDTVFLKAHTGNFIDVDGVSVRARWQNRNSWEALILERAPGQFRWG